MTWKLLVAALCLSTSQISWAQRYPLRPDPSLTPGTLCLKADQIRYPEKIKYCERDVETQTKYRVIHTYDARFGYGIAHQNRADYKIDHYIPLCMGGSNEMTNLWPQHKSVYVQTDPLEALMCEKMQAGRLKQKDAVALIKRAKNDHSQIRAVHDYVRRL